MTLAIDGGTPVRTSPVPTWPVVSPAQIAAAEAVLRSGKVSYWTGSECRAFEDEYAHALGRAHGIALANGTVALELALRVFGVGPGDEVIVPARTFIATASAAAAVGAVPVVADVDRDSGNLTPRTVADALTERTRAVIPVHLGGWPADVPGMRRLVADRDIVVIEDCAQAHGAVFEGGEIGSLGDAAAFSFCQDKIITTAGEGGMLLLDDDAVFEAAWSYKDHGKSRAKSLDPANAPGTMFKWLHDSFGTNWRLTELQGAIGRVALRELPGYLERRARNAERLIDAISGVPFLRIPRVAPGSTHAYYRVYAYVIPDALAPGWDRDRVLRSVAAEGVPCFYGSCSEIHRERAFVDAGLAPARPLPVAAELHETALAFLVHPTLGDGDIDDIVAAVLKVAKEAAA